MPSKEDVLRLKLSLRRKREAGGTVAASEPKTKRTAGEYLSETASNIPESFSNSVQGYVDLVSHPFKAYDSMIDLGQGIITKAMDKVPPKYQRQSDLASAVGQRFKNRYGGLDNIADTFRTDPSGFVEDASMLFGNAPGIVGKAARAIDPLNAVANAATILPKKVMRSAALKNMESATRFSGKGVDPKKSAKIMLDDKLDVSRKSIPKLQDIINNLNTERTNILNKADATGWEATPMDIVSPLEDLRSKQMGMGATDAKKAIRDIDKVESAYLYGKGGQKVKPSDLSQSKTSWDADINWDNNNKLPSSSRFTQEAKTALANSARKQVADVAPGLDAVNKTLGPRIELQPLLEKSIYASERAPVIPMNSPLRMLVGSQLGGKIGAGVGALSGQLGKAGPQSRAALKMNSIADILEFAMRNRRIFGNIRGIDRAIEDGYPQ